MNVNPENIKLFILFTLFLLLLNMPEVFPQKYMATVRGSVTDKDTREALIGANVVISDSNSFKVATSDTNGNFKISNIPVGRHTVKVSYMGYEDYLAKDIEIVTGKELILNIELVEKVITGREVVITAKRNKESAVNDMSTISARSFTVEETQKYAGSWGDPSRMASNYAGVSIVSDKRNDIIVRGNSPIGVLWRMEGVDIPNPNHFAIAGSSGGAISMINNNLLTNSDFITSAFAPEYGNATSAVFDLKMRSGNNSKHEYVAQAGVNGFELGAEGPFTASGNSSYLINYRYSTLAVLHAMGISIIDAVPNFQDISFKLNFPAKKSTISVFGIGGKSAAVSTPEEDTLKWKNADDRLGYSTGSQMAIAGISLTYLLSKKTYFKLTYSASANNPFFQDDSMDCSYRQYITNRYSTTETTQAINFSANTKFSQHHIIRYGACFKNSGINTDAYYFTFTPEETKHTVSKLKENTSLLQSFIQWKYNITGNLSAVSGIHLMDFFLNNDISFEPRAAVRWAFAKKHSVSIGFGIHRLNLPLQVYYAQVRDSMGNISMPNRSLSFIQSRHYVVGYDWSVSENLRTKFELYYQYIDKVPADESNSALSLLNFGTDDNIFTETKYVNNGKGSNYGIETTIEKFFSENYYFLITASLFNSSYKDVQGVERSTRYDCRHAFNLLAGKEFIFGKQDNNIFGIHITAVNIGGQHYTPIDLIASEAMGKTVYIDSLAYSGKFDDFLKINLKINFRINSSKFSQELGLEINNILNRRNIESRYYDAATQTIWYVYQLERLPIVFYRIIF